NILVIVARILLRLIGYLLSARNKIVYVGFISSNYTSFIQLNRVPFTKLNQNRNKQLLNCSPIHSFKRNSSPLHCHSPEKGNPLRCHCHSLEKGNPLRCQCHSPEKGNLR